MIYLRFSRESIDLHKGVHASDDISREMGTADIFQRLPSIETDLLQRFRNIEATQEHLELAILSNNLGIMYHRQGRFADADGAHKRCASTLQQFDDAQRLLAQSLANRAALYRTFHEYHEAERLFQVASTIWGRQGWPLQNEMRHNLEEASGGLTTEMLWAEPIEPSGLLRVYSREVQKLKESPELLTDTVAKLGPWYHDIQLTPEISTCPLQRQYMVNRWRFLSEVLPADLSGKTVLDIGCNGGFFSLQMKQRNADRVVGIDIMPHCLAQARFVSHWFGQPVELRELGVYDVESLGPFDIVVFIGVLYHLRHPLYAIDKVASICKETMYLQSLVRGDSGDFVPEPNYPLSEYEVFKRSKFPRMYFIEKSINDDASNWWVPNTSCLMAMARSAGFRTVRESSHPELIVCKK